MGRGLARGIMRPRRVLFWIHLSAGVLASCVIFIMAITGVVLAFERQIVQWSDSRYRTNDVFTQPRIPIDVLAGNLKSTRGESFSTITLRSDPHSPVEFSYGRDRTVFMNPYTGKILGESHGIRALFVQVENIHRWLGMKTGNRSPGHSITSAATLIFLLLIMSGPFLWWPKTLSWTNLRKIVVFDFELSGRAFFWNLHNVLGIWCALPLFAIALSGVVMSYGWATNLVYRATGNKPPVLTQPAARTEAGHLSNDERASQIQRLAPDQQRGRKRGTIPETTHMGDSTPTPVATDSPVTLDILFNRAAEKVRDWRSITMRPGKGPETIFMIDAGDGGRPDLRSTLTLNRSTGEIVRWEPFSSYNSGRQLRTWFRFTHTGEAFGIPGEAIAALASASAAMLAFSGLTMSWMRFRKRRSAPGRSPLVQEQKPLCHPSGI
jgi:uncharacterized iron-regulated membrane protein